MLEICRRDLCEEGERERGGDWDTKNLNKIFYIYKIFLFSENLEECVWNIYTHTHTPVCMPGMHFGKKKTSRWSKVFNNICV